MQFNVKFFYNLSYLQNNVNGLNKVNNENNENNENDNKNESLTNNSNSISISKILPNSTNKSSLIPNSFTVSLDFKLNDLGLLSKSIYNKDALDIHILDSDFKEMILYLKLCSIYIYITNKIYSGLVKKNNRKFNKNRGGRRFFNKTKRNIKKEKQIYKNESESDEGNFDSFI